MSVMTRHMKKILEESTPPRKTISDVPPEILEMIFKKLDCGDNSLLPYRCVHPTWTNTINGILERQALKGDLTAYSKVFIGNDGNWPRWPIPTIRYPRTILHHPGNPFPSRSLLVTWKATDPRYYGIHPIVRPLDTFTTKFGSHLNIFEVARVNLKFEALIQILTPLSSLKILRLSGTHVEINVKLLQDDLKSFPVLPHLTTLELKFVLIYCDEMKIDCDELFFTKLTDAYGSQLISLRLESNEIFIPLQPQIQLVDNTLFPNLRELKVFNATKRFLCLSFVPPLKHLSIINVVKFIEPNIDEMSIGHVMRFVDKFSDTLESLSLDILWRYLYKGHCKQKADKTGGILPTSEVIFPKLTKFTVAYPTNQLEAAVIKKTLVVKFPALQQLRLVNFCVAYKPLLVYRDPTQIFKDVIREFLSLQNYPRECPTLTSISVWFGGELKYVTPPGDNFRIYLQDVIRLQQKKLPSR